MLAYKYSAWGRKCQFHAEPAVRTMGRSRMQVVPATISDAFDLTTTDVQPWELEQVRAAAAAGVIHLGRHARLAAIDDSIPWDAFVYVVVNGVPTKDVTEDGGRRVGINFRAKIADGRWLEVKVSWAGEPPLIGYHYATVYPGKKR